MKKLLVFAVLWHAFAFSADENEYEQKGSATLCKSQRQVDELTRLRKLLKDGNKTQLNVLKPLLEAKESYLKAYKLCHEEKDNEAKANEAKGILLTIVKQHQKSQNKKIQKTMAEAAFLIFRINLNKMLKMHCKLNLMQDNRDEFKEQIDAFFSSEILVYLRIAAESGHVDAQAQLVLYSLPPEIEDDYINNDLIKISIENNLKTAHSLIKPLLGFKLAYEFFIRNDNKRDKIKADQIFDELLETNNSEYRFKASMGKLLLAKKSKDKDAVASALEFAINCYLEKDRFIWDPYTLYEFAMAVYELSGSEEGKKFAKVLLEQLKYEYNYTPAIYYLQEISEAMDPPPAEIQPKILEPLDSPVATKILEAAMVIHATSEVEPKTLEAPSAIPLTTKKLKSKKNPKVMVQHNIKDSHKSHQVVIFSATARNDFDTIVRKNKGIPEELERISLIGQDIINAKGQCKSKLASKIIGTKNFWRSYLGRDYRMDWQYDTFADGPTKIVIRHIGLKRSFTYKQ